MKKALLISAITLFATLCLVLGVSGVSDTDGYTLISTPAEFFDINEDLSGNYRLAQSIDFTDMDFTQIGSAEMPFSGNFDGGGYTLEGITLSKVSESDIYLAPFIFNKGVIAEVIFENITVVAESSENVYASAAVAINEGVISNAEVKNGNVSANANYKTARASSICALNCELGEIIDCMADASVTATSQRLYADAAGISAINIGSITNSHTSGEITAVSVKSDAFSGGIAGSGNGSVISCSNSANISAESERGYAYADGICRAEEGSGCVNTGDVLVNGFPIGLEAAIGDVNRDDSVDLIDLIILSRYNANWKGYDQTTVYIHAADVDGDGDVGVLDATILARYVANWKGYEKLPYKG